MKIKEAIDIISNTTSSDVVGVPVYGFNKIITLPLINKNINPETALNKINYGDEKQAVEKGEKPKTKKTRKTKKKI